MSWPFSKRRRAERRAQRDAEFQRMRRRVRLQVTLRTLDELHVESRNEIQREALRRAMGVVNRALIATDKPAGVYDPFGTRPP